MKRGGCRVDDGDIYTPESIFSRFYAKQLVIIIIIINLISYCYCLLWQAERK